MKQAKDWPILRNLIYSLVLFGSVKTTQYKARAIRGLVDKLVNKTKKGTVASKREVLKILPQKEAVDKLAKEIVPKLGSRVSGYTRILKIGNRAGDGAMIVLMQWVTDTNMTNLANETNSTKEEKMKEKNPPSPRLRRTRDKTDKNK